MVEMSAAMWSAVAASFAALSSFLIMLIQRRMLHESLRPEVVLDDWTRAVEGPADTVVFSKIKNVGRGAAFNVMVSGFVNKTADNKPTSILSATRLPLVAPNESVDVKGEITIFWSNIEGPRKHALLKVRVLCWDSKSDRRYDTQYVLFVTPTDGSWGISHEMVAPWVMSHDRVTKVRWVKWLKLLAAFRRVRVVGKWLPEDV